MYFKFYTPTNEYTIEMCKDYYISRIKEIFKKEHKDKFYTYVFSIKDAIPYFIKELVDEYTVEESLRFRWTRNMPTKNPLRNGISFMVCRRPLIFGYVSPNDLIEYYLKYKGINEKWTYQLDLMMNELMESIYSFLEER